MIIFALVDICDYFCLSGHLWLLLPWWTFVIIFTLVDICGYFRLGGHVIIFTLVNIRQLCVQFLCYMES